MSSEFTTAQKDTSEDPVLEVRNLEKHYVKSAGWIESLFTDDERVRAVDGVSISIDKGEIFSVVGESGCGKTTLGKTLLRVIEPTAGEIRFNGTDLASLSDSEMQTMRQHLQIVYQDPFEALNPKRTVWGLLCQPMEIHGITDYQEQRDRIHRALTDVNLLPVTDFLDRYPEELSGGQLQRVLFARALVLDPEFIVADEPSSMLDASVRARVLDLIDELRDERNISFFIITHDIGAARYLSDRIGVMYLGRIVEMGDANAIVDDPKHPYSKALVESIPSPDPREPLESSKIGSEVPEPIDLPSGCRFHPRCPIATDHCRQVDPEWREVPTEEDDERMTECHEVEPKQTR
ncbi:ABC transporter ATP-binding protein [Halorubrum ezzemoulense]|uniref:Oligopeptide ABC transporter ATP-binding protein n=1 Tax=Halorubrum ezzemoulense TaxID=337243 RepID=A0A256JY52_HALEZ|nr:ABC transporter ATP-binding protein [Halorubrum ezzemoulense]OYR73476.1 oligopeptide ABC transporter ATP-binding protein [Halorubrum ezzemoulense]